jgi:hypothetical protein
MLEEIYIVSQKTKDGDFNKLAKSQEQWWYSKQEAVDWLAKKEDWFRKGNAVFKVIIEITKIEKVYDELRGVDVDE